jgi:hypothetical protein
MPDVVLLQSAIIAQVEAAKLIVGARRDAQLVSLIAEIEAGGGNAAALEGEVRSEAHS